MHGRERKYNLIYIERNGPAIRVVGYGPFSLCIIHKEGLFPISGDNNRLIMKMRLSVLTAYN
jgi:hypothetical protein